MVFASWLLLYRLMAAQNLGGGGILLGNLIYSAFALFIENLRPFESRQDDITKVWRSCGGSM
jgi:hypothetical protein